MPQIKTSLKDLFALFMRSAENPDLDMPVRQLAARMTVLTAHMQRIEAKIDAAIGFSKATDKKVDSGIAELVQHILLINQKIGNVPATAPAEGQNGDNGAPTDGPPGEETAEEMASRIMAETEAEAARLRQGQPAAPNGNGNGAPAPVTPIRQTTAMVPATPPTGDAS